MVYGTAARCPPKVVYTYTDFNRVREVFLDIASATSRCALGPGSACGRACALCAACPALCPGSTCGKRCSLSAGCPARCPGSACGKKCSPKPNGGAVLCLHVPLPPEHPQPPLAVRRSRAKCGKGCSLSPSSSRTFVLRGYRTTTKTERRPRSELLI